MDTTADEEWREAMSKPISGHRLNQPQEPKVGKKRPPVLQGGREDFAKPFQERGTKTSGPNLYLAE
jgi:hypothetical protein